MEDDDYPELYDHIRECLESTFVAVLAVKEKQGAWATPIYFTYDKQFNFYFMSNGKTRHIKDIESDPKVSLALFMPQSGSMGFRVGLQISGTAAVVPDAEIEKVYMNRSMRLTGDNAWNKDSTGAHLIKDAGWVFIKIIPESMNYTDRRYFGEDGKVVSVKKLIETGKRISP